MPVPSLVGAVSLVIQLYLTKAFVQTAMQPAFEFNAFKTLLLAVVVVVLMNTLAVVGMALTMNLVAYAVFEMEPGNVVPIINAHKYEMKDPRLDVLDEQLLESQDQDSSFY